MRGRSPRLLAARDLRGRATAPGRPGRALRARARCRSPRRHRSVLSRSPAVSANRKGIPSSATGRVRTSRVVPGIGVAIAASALNQNIEKCALSAIRRARDDHPEAFAQQFGARTAQPGADLLTQGLDPAGEVGWQSGDVVLVGKIQHGLKAGRSTEQAARANPRPGARTRRRPWPWRSGAAIRFPPRAGRQAPRPRRDRSGHWRRRGG